MNTDYRTSGFAYILPTDFLSVLIRVICVPKIHIFVDLKAGMC